MKLNFIIRHVILGLFLITFANCQPSAAESEADASATTTETETAPEEMTGVNTLSEAEVEAGWELLFNGEDLSQWHTYGQDTIGTAWKIDADGSFYLDNTNKNEWQVVGGGDIVTNEAYENYELSLEWKIDSCGNSGIIYNIVEDDRSQYPWQTGPEMQILDDDCHPDGKYDTHRAGCLYDMLVVSKETVKPAREWNTVRLVVTDGKVEQWLNGHLAVEYPNAGPEWVAMIAGSKFKDMELFGLSTSGKIGLQDHGDKVSFRNVKIRNL